MCIFHTSQPISVRREALLPAPYTDPVKFTPHPIYLKSILILYHFCLKRMRFDGEEV
jgi:hypothetical protein